LIWNSESIHIEAFRFNESNHWELEEYNAFADDLPVRAIHESILLSEIFEGVNFGS
jgi:Uma2 family endonuclease